jgi:cell division protein ZapE
MSITQNIIDELKNQGAEPDLNQIKLINALSDIKFFKKFSLNKFFLKESFGIYIWGDVGRGKTLISKTYLKLKRRNDSKSFHYIELMDFIHQELVLNSGHKNPLKKVATKLTKNTSIIFIDEFQVEDVADAMIIGDLLQMVIENNTKLMITSNSHPKKLYKEGLQREKFIKSLDKVLTKIKIFNLEGEIDYRTRNIIEFEDYKKFNVIDDKQIFKFIEKNFSVENLKPNKIKINGREFSCKHVSKNILWIEFNKFFKEPTHSKDYKYISIKFDWIFISNFISTDDEQIDIIRRFISFIDIAYANKTKIKFFFNNFDKNKIYLGNKINNLWLRCNSRLAEMQNKEYFFNINRNKN